MTPSDLNFAATCVRALNMVAQAAKEWIRLKALESAPKKNEDEDSQQ